MDNKLHIYMSVVQRCFSRRVMDSAQTLGLLPGQPKVLEHLLVHDGCTRRDIGLAWNVDKSTMSGIIARMERDGLIYISENPSDRRRKLLFLTEKGRAARQQLYAETEEIDRNAREGISDEELKTFFAVMDRIRSNLTSENNKKERDKNE